MTAMPLAHAIEERLARAAAAAGGRALFALHVQGPGAACPWQGAAGRADHGDATGVWRIASITKSFVAAAVLRLTEQGALALDDPIGAHLPAATVAILRAAGYATDAITVRMLLDHTSGIADFVGDEYVSTLLAAPHQIWTRAEQLALAMRQPRPGAPGERYLYCDTNYSLLGEALEQASGQPLAAAVRALSGIAALGLQHTWFETLEPQPPSAPPRVAQQYQHGDVALPVAGFHASIDLFGAGGLLSTLPDLARYFRALVSGSLFAQPQTIESMRSASRQSRAAGGIAYGLGLELLEVDGLTCWGHTGFWGIAAWHCPAHDFTVTAAMSNTVHKDALARLVQDVVLALARD